MRAIIPAAGFGTRMGVATNESKEMMVDPKTGKPLIQWTLDLCQEKNLIPLVITRKEKEDLIAYLETQNVDYLLVEPSGEWSKTVLESYSYWEDDNVLLLPDTRFEPSSIIDNIKDSLRLGCDAVFAVHKVEDGSNWGVVKDYSVYEKKPNLKEEFAWGIIGFSDKEGHRLFRALEYDKFFHIHNSGILFLDKFKDITRKGKIESY